MGELVKSGGRLEVSVSFGRFENDALAWEKWSSFSPNKYMEEVGSLSTPGSVAQKKAYFEAHYKKIAAAAKKAEELELENSKYSVTPTPDGSCSESSTSIDNTAISVSNGERLVDENADAALSNGERFVEENADPANMKSGKVLMFDDEVEDNNAESAERDEWISCIDSLIESTSSGIDVDIAHAEEAKYDVKYDAVDSKPDDRDDSTGLEIDADIVNADEAKDELKYNTIDSKPDCRDDSKGCEIDAAIGNAEEAKDELKYNAVDSRPDGRDDSDLAGVEILQEDSPLIVAKASKQKNALEHSRALKKGNSKLKNTTQKVTPAKKDRSVTETPRKSIASPVVKSSKALVPRVSKPTSISTPITASKKKVIGSMAPNGVRATPTSLHMSLSLGPTKSSAVVPITRKSLIMEQMGDKDIVKRAFKSFQNFNTGLSTDERLSSVKQVQSPALKPKVSTSPAPRKGGSEGLRKDVKELTPQRIQSGTRSKALQSRSDISSAPKNPMAVSPSTGLRSDERAEKRKEFLKNLEAKSIARGAQNSQRSAKSKEEKESEIKTRRESLNFKAKPIPSFYRDQEKRHLEKEHQELEGSLSGYLY